MKKILSGLLALTLAASLFAAPEDKVINLWSFTDEVPGMVEKYLTHHRAPTCACSGRGKNIQ